MPRCEAEAGPRAEVIIGEVIRGDTFLRSTPSGWILRLAPIRDGLGWFLSVSVKGRESEDISRLTPPWHFVPNPREIEGWHVRPLARRTPKAQGHKTATKLLGVLFEIDGWQSRFGAGVVFR